MGKVTERLIREREVADLLIEACPSFEKKYKVFEDRQHLYLVAAEFARHLVELELTNKTSEFGDVVEFLESLHVHGTPMVREMATIGFLESIQKFYESAGISPDVFGKKLLPESRKWWDKLNRYWEGEAEALRKEYEEE